MLEPVRSRRAHVAAIGAASAAALAAALIPAAAAQAAPATIHALSPLHAVGAVQHISGRQAFTFTIVVPGKSVAGRPSVVRPQTLACSVYADPPFEYYGGTYGGGEEGLASTSCSPSVYSLEVEVALFLGTSEVSYGSNTTYSTVSTSADTVYPLVAGSYTTEMEAIVVPTFGATPEYSGVYATTATYLP